MLSRICGDTHAVLHNSPILPHYRGAPSPHVLARDTKALSARDRKPFGPTELSTCPTTVDLGTGDADDDTCQCVLQPHQIDLSHFFRLSTMGLVSMIVIPRARHVFSAKLYKESSDDAEKLSISKLQERLTLMSRYQALEQRYSSSGESSDNCGCRRRRFRVINLHFSAL